MSATTATVYELHATLQDAALDLAARGFRVFPLKPDGKAPRGDMRAWPDKATGDPQRVRDLWQHEPRSNVGVLTGDGLVVVDLDRKHGVDGVAAFKTLAALHGAKPTPTLNALTPSGGRHLFYAVPAGVAIANSTGKLAPGIDIKAARGYVVGAGSRMDGQLYRWQDSRAPVADCPPWLLALLTAEPDRPAPAPREPHALLQDDFRQMLEHITAETYGDWCGVLWALRGSEQDGLDLRELADEWSREQPNYGGPDDVRDKYEQGDGRLGIGSLWTLAKAGGWEPTPEQVARLRAPVDPAEHFDKIPETVPAGISRHIADIIGERRTVQWLPGVRDILERRVIALFVGPHGTYKTAALLLILVRAALAGTPVLLLYGEGGGLGRRALALLKELAPGHDPLTVPFHAIERRFDLASPAGLAAIRAEAKRLKLTGAIIAVDTYSKYSSHDKDDNTAASAFLNGMDSLRAEFDSTVCLTAHTGHGDKSRAKGASSLVQDSDTEFVFAFDKGANVVTMTRERFKDSPSLPPLTFSPRVVTLDYLDDEGNAVTSVVLDAAEPTIPRPSRRQEPAGEYAARILEVMRDLAPTGNADLNDLRAEVVKRTPLKKTRRGDDRRAEYVDKAIGKLVNARWLFLDRETQQRVSLLSVVEVADLDAGGGT